MSKTKEYQEIYMSSEGKQMLKTTRLTIDTDSVLIEAERREISMTEVEKFMEEQGKQMPKTFKVVDLNKWVQWRQGKVQDQEFEEWARPIN